MQSFLEMLNRTSNVFFSESAAALLPTGSSWFTHKSRLWGLGLSFRYGCFFKLGVLVVSVLTVALLFWGLFYQGP